MSLPLRFLSSWPVVSAHKLRVASSLVITELPRVGQTPTQGPGAE